ncbi:hypothetical protein GGR72_001024 [Xanthomonas arboricola]|nr:hypothetical protein [Xanthomonas arboricola]NJB92698.1 hypothetical protein [Xanthomonas arboricola]
MLVEIAHHRVDHRLHLAEQGLLCRGFAGIAIAGVDQQVEQAACGMAVAHEQVAVQHRQLGHRHQQLAEQAALRIRQMALHQDRGEQQGHQIQRVLVVGVEAGGGRIHPKRGGGAPDLLPQATCQARIGAVDGIEAGRRHGLQQRQRRHHLARRQQALPGRCGRVAIGFALAACMLQQMVQAGRQQLAAAAQMHVDRLDAGQRALPARPVGEEACDPVRRLGGLLAGAFVLARNAAPPAARLRQLAQARHLHQCLFQRAVALADAFHQVLLADLDHRQMRLGRQRHPLKGLVQGHAQMLRPERIAVAIDTQPAGNEAQIAIEPHQLRAPLVLQRAGQVAHRQAHLQVLLGQQGQPGRTAAQAAIGRQRPPGFQPLPGLGQMPAETRGDRLALLPHRLDRLQEVVLGRAGIGRQLEQRLGQCVLELDKGIGQRHQHNLAYLVEQLRIAAGEHGGGYELGHRAAHRTNMEGMSRPGRHRPAAHDAAGVGKGPSIIARILASTRNYARTVFAPGAGRAPLGPLQTAGRTRPG